MTLGPLPHTVKPIFDIAGRPREVRLIVERDPVNPGRGAEPGLLAFRELAGLEGDPPARLLERVFAPEVRDELPIPQGPGTRGVPGKGRFEQGPDLIQESAPELAVEPRRDALRERGTLPAQAEEERGKRVRCPLAAECRDRTPRQLVNLERADDPDRIAGMDGRERLRIHLAEIAPQRFQSLLLDPPREARPDRLVARGPVEETLEQGPHVEPRSARHDGKLPLRLDLEYQGAGFLAVVPGAVGLGGIEERDEVVRDARSILGRGGLGPDLQPPVDLTRVRAHDLPAEALGEIQRDEALSGGRRSYEDDSPTGGQNADPAPPSRPGRTWGARGDRHAGGSWRTADRRARAARSGSGPGRSGPRHGTRRISRCAPRGARPPRPACPRNPAPRAATRSRPPREGSRARRVWRPAARRRAKPRSPGGGGGAPS